MNLLKTPQRLGLVNAHCSFMVRRHSHGCRTQLLKSSLPIVNSEGCAILARLPLSHSENLLYQYLQIPSEFSK